MNTTDFWINFWKEHGKNTRNKDDQVQVLRTLNKKPIENDLWEETLKDIEHKIKLSPNDVLLDLCCGNGLISKYFSNKCSEIIAVDISEDLIDNLINSSFKNIHPIVSDMRSLNLETASIDCIIFYAGIQYLEYSEAVCLFNSMFKWLKPNGTVFIGDIPDNNKLWTFFNDKNRESDYFSLLGQGKGIVGTWFEKKWLLKLSKYSGFKEAKIIQQREDFIYSKFRYDMLIYK